ncbi:uncharacterized protein LOC100213014 isoform X1 [Hydra vulgaris]|nr:uncharacterized protein LOC100213014 [Hydra vulgaris]
MDSKIIRKKKTSFKDNVIKIREIMQGALGSNFVPDDNLWIHIFRQERLSRCLNGNLNATSDFEVLTQAILEQLVDHEMKMQSDDHSPMKKHNSDSKMPTPPVDIIIAILQLKNSLLKLSPGLYNDIGAKLDFLLVDKRAACKTYSNFSEAMFEKCISWPLIVSFLLFSANLAAECIKNGRHKLVRNIYDWATLFTTLKLKGWIIENGGWEGLASFAKQDRKKPKRKYVILDIGNFFNHPLSIKTLSVLIWIPILILLFAWLVNSQVKNKYFKSIFKQTENKDFQNFVSNEL